VAQDRDRRADARRHPGRPTVTSGALSSLLVVDSSAAVQACLAAEGFALFGDEDLAAPALLWSEASSVIHELWWRREISEELASTAFDALLTAPIAARAPRRLRTEAWRIAEELGWAKTDDAEYVALARILRCRLFTVDDRLRRGAERVVEIIGPRDL
jgi:predicted nucleic acid-binding protein